MPLTESKSFSSVSMEFLVASALFLYPAERLSTLLAGHKILYIISLLIEKFEKNISILDEITCSAFELSVLKAFIRVPSFRWYYWIWAISMYHSRRNFYILYNKIVLIYQGSSPLFGGKVE